MTKITAIELENFQAIDKRVRIELKPITLLYGPNSAGKSSIFDAIELLQILLVPGKFDQKKASDMVERCARRPGKDGWRETGLAIEFPFQLWSNYQCDQPPGEHEIWDAIFDLWQGSGDIAEGQIETNGPCFIIDDVDLFKKLYGKTVRIALTLKVIDNTHLKKCFISEFSIYLGGTLIGKMEKISGENREFKSVYGNSDKLRWLTLDGELGFIDDPILIRLKRTPKKDFSQLFSKTEKSYRINLMVSSRSLSPRLIDLPDEMDYPQGIPRHGESLGICKNMSDIFFFFGAMLWAPLRKSPELVYADRRAPKPEEALTVVDLGLRGWWDESAFAPLSTTLLIKSFSKPIDKHYQYLAEVAHAELMLRTSKNISWGSPHAAEHIAWVKSRAETLDRVNHHLQKSLFTDKLYQLTCASTLMVPIDLREDNPWSYYALAQPATVRLFLQDSTGQKVDLHDVGSGIPFVLPVLYAVSAQGFICVQQPELHLHPALQSSLADVFIEELHREGCGQFLIETHSEHFLLRLLRRIRNTEKGKSLSEDLKLINDQIAVYYFDPQVGGGTFVSRQLVTPLGDFYNDWPRGFFSERNDDLFDE